LVGAWTGRSADVALAQFREGTALAAHNVSDFSGRMDRTLSRRMNARSLGSIYAEVEFQRDDYRTGGDRNKDPFEKLRIDNVKQAPLADATDARYVHWAISG
jgi:hypothetical protein